MLQSINPTKTKSWQLLQKQQEKLKNTHLAEIFSADSKRFTKYSINFNDNILLDYSKNRITDEVLGTLFSLARECKLDEAIKKMFSGEKINQTENRSVQHVDLRKTDETEVLSEVQKVLRRMKTLSDKVSTGKRLGYNAQTITDVVNIGIGGSDLGPQMAYEALRPYHSKMVNVHFVSNIDGSHIHETLKKIKPETTLFIIASKTFSTQETISNAIVARKWFLETAQNEKFIEQHFVAVTANVKAAVEFGINQKNCFEFWDWVGGRFSLCSTVGLSLACGIGYKNFEKMLHGFRLMDRHFYETDFEKNIPVILALIGIWYNNFFNYQTEAVLPYDQYLNRLVSYLQQCSMESNGKSVDRSGNIVDYKTAPIVWGGVGTNNQHSFFQLLHQGTQIIPCDFLVPVTNHHEYAEHQQKLLANFIAQTEALAFGNHTEHDFKKEPYRHFFGNRPSNSIMYRAMTPTTLGSLIAMYEHKVFVQGVIWNIFSFDQWGVELGKKLAEVVLQDLKSAQIVNSHDASTNGLINHTIQLTKK